jgi:four helix bundle protein
MLIGSSMAGESTRERPPTFENGQDIRDRAFDYACRVVEFCEQLTAAGGVGRLMVPQLLDCSLSFATMLEEARAAESDADFISKCCISLKECRESWTRIRVCRRGKKGPEKIAIALVREGGELIAIVSTIIANKRRSVAAKRAAEKAAKAAAESTRHEVRERERRRQPREPRIPNS